MEFVIVCSEKGIIQEIIKDSTNELTIGNSLFPFVDSFSIPKILTFYQEIQQNGSALNWEVNFCVNESLCSFTISGIFRANEIQIFGYTASDNTEKVINDLSDLSNQQSLLLRSSIKENIKNTKLSEQEDGQIQLLALKNENKWLKKQWISANQEVDKQIESKLSGFNAMKAQLPILHEKLELIHDELAYSVQLITEDYAANVLSRRNELSEITAQLNMFNELLLNFPQITH